MSYLGIIHAVHGPIIIYSAASIIIVIIATHAAANRDAKSKLFIKSFEALNLTHVSEGSTTRGAPCI